MAHGPPELSPPFPYVEASSQPTRQVRWQAPPGVETLRLLTFVDGAPHRAATVTAAQGALSVPLSWATAGASVSFGLQALLPNGKAGPEARTPAFYIQRASHGAYVWAVVAAATAAIAVLALALFIRNRRRLAEQKGATTVVLVYEHASDRHLAVLRALAAFLRSAGGLDVLLDEEHIPLSRMDPVSWYQEALLHADVALLVSSPEPPPPGGAAAGLYPEAAQAAQQLVAPRLAVGGRCLALNLPGRFRLLPAARGLRLLRAVSPSSLQRLARQLRGSAGRRYRESSADRALAKHVLQLCVAQEETVKVHLTDVPEDYNLLINAPPPVHDREILEALVPAWTRPLRPQADDVDSQWDLQQMDLLGGAEGDKSARAPSGADGQDFDTISLDL